MMALVARRPLVVHRGVVELYHRVLELMHRGQGCRCDSSKRTRPVALQLCCGNLHRQSVTVEELRRGKLQDQQRRHHAGPLLQRVAAQVFWRSWKTGNGERSLQIQKVLQKPGTAHRWTTDHPRRLGLVLDHQLRHTGRHCSPVILQQLHIGSTARGRLACNPQLRRVFHATCHGT